MQFLPVKKCYVIAEVGVNHNGDVELAKRMIDAVVETGADAVKFQSFKADRLAKITTPKVKYQEASGSAAESHLEMLKSLELDFSQQEELFQYCGNAGLDFISTPYDTESAAFLVNLGVKFIKTASADLVDVPLHRYLAEQSVPVIIATGMANFEEIGKTLDIYRSAKHGKLVLLHCVSNYPCSFSSINMRSMVAMAEEFGLPVGFSDHSIDALAAAASIALGGVVVEKHFTLDKIMQGPDHKASSTPEEFTNLVTTIRQTELLLGSAEKKLRDEEAEMLNVSRKSLAFGRSLKKGTFIGESDICLIRPNIGISPYRIDEVINRKLARDVAALDHMKWDDFLE